ncbi:MAG: bifunctional DNA-formamidopyrimidine glycosylase/DNA-(apurinic or apyrimidinic site) lyase [Nitrospinota bacterium]
MPELPEVETLRCALLPLVKNQVCSQIKFFRKDLRFPIPQNSLKEGLLNETISDITRQGKYLLFKAPKGSMLLHLGMSGRMALQKSMEPQEKHTHAIFKFSTNNFLHFVDPRRFGSISWVPESGKHPLIDKLGCDPFSDAMKGKTMKALARKSRAPMKSFIMNSQKISGIGNIYACESLYHAGIRPTKQAGKITLSQWEKWIDCIRDVLNKSISSGGTTLRDFFDPNGSQGYFSVSLSVYGKEGQPCPKCSQPISRKIHSGRSTFYCKTCQS